MAKYQGPIKPGTSESIFRGSGKSGGVSDESAMSKEIAPQKKDTIEKLKIRKSGGGSKAPTPTMQYAEPIGPTKQNIAAPFTSNTLSSQLQQAQTEKRPTGTTAQQVKTQTFDMPGTKYERYQGVAEKAEKRTFLQRQRAKGGAYAFGAGVAAPFVGTAMYAKELVVNPKETLKQTGKGIYETGKKVVTGEGFPEVSNLIEQEPSYFLGEVAGNVALFKGGKVLGKVPEKLGYPKYKTRFVSEELPQAGDELIRVKTKSITEQKNLIGSKNFYSDVKSISKVTPEDKLTKIETFSVGQSYDKALEIPTGKFKETKPKPFYSISKGKIKQEDLNILISKEPEVRRKVEGTSTFYSASKTTGKNKKPRYGFNIGFSKDIDDSTSLIYGKSYPVKKGFPLTPLKSGRGEFMGFYKRPTDSVDIILSGKQTRIRPNFNQIIKQQQATAIQSALKREPIIGKVQIVAPRMQKNLISKQTFSSPKLELKQKQTDFQLLGSKTNQISKQLSFPKTKKGSRNLLKTNGLSRQDLSLGLGLGLGQRQDQRLAIRPIQRQLTRSYPKTIPAIDSIMALKPFKIDMPFKDSGKKRKRKGRKGRTKYKPSLAAVGLNIKAFKVPKSYKLGLGGFGIRPLIVKKRRSKKKKK